MKYSPRIINIENETQARSELEHVGVDPSAIKIMTPKEVFRTVKVRSVRPLAANVLKQEMLAVGGEAAVSYGTLNQSVKNTDVIITGTLKQFSALTKKLKAHAFDLPRVALEVDKTLDLYDSKPQPIKVGSLKLNFGKRTYIMGVLNVTPDSFSDGGKFVDVDKAVSHALEMVKDGADIIDVGGESTRPGAKAVSVKDELKRVIPVIEKIRKKTKAPISIDTTKSEVARQALAAGADMVNDVSGLRFDKKLAKIAARNGVPVILMHIQGKPRSMQRKPLYKDLIGEILDYLSKSIKIAEAYGISRKNIIIDPGIGFGKTVKHNLEILKRLKEFRALGRPILIGTSRKSVIGKTLGLPVEERLEGTAATVSLSILNGADIIRVHDVKQMSRVAKMMDAVVR